MFHRWKVDFYKNMQAYKCKSCGREFTELSKSKYSKHRFPKKTIFFCYCLQMHYLCAVIDDKSQVIALYVSKRMGMHSTVLCLRKAKYIAGRPEIIVTDG